MWEFSPTFDAAHRAALEADKPLVYVCPPAAWAVLPLAARWSAAEPAALDLVLAADPATAADLAEALATIPSCAPAHAVTGHARAAGLLAAGAVRTLVTTPDDALALTRRSALPLATVPHLVLAWPEQTLAAGQADQLDAVLAETGAAQRLIVTSDAHLPALADLLQRVAHRAPVVAAAPLPPERLAVPVRYVTTDDDRRPAVGRAVLDTLHPSSWLLWDPAPGRGRWASLLADPTGRPLGTDASGEAAAVAIAGDLPSADALTDLAAAAREIVVLLRPGQVPYLQRLTAATRPLRVRGESDAALDRAAALRRRLRERLAAGALDGELLAIGPLLDEWDPAAVAAAAAALIDAPVPTAPAVPAWARVFVTAGRRDGIRPGDLLGALLNEVGLPRPAVGKIELRDGFALIEIRADEAERAVRGLTGLTLRGKRVSARPDRA